MTDIQDSLIAIFLYRATLATFVVVISTIILGGLAALLIEFLEDMVRAAKRKAKERLRGFLAAPNASGDCPAR